MTEELKENAEIENSIEQARHSEDEYDELDEQDLEAAEPDAEDSPELDIEQQIQDEDEDFAESDIEAEAPAEEDEEFAESETEDSAESDIEEQALEENESEPSEPSDESRATSDEELTVESVLEAVLFASDEPLTAARLANIVEVTTKQIREHIESLNNKYQAGNHAFRIEQIAGGYQMLTLSDYNYWLKQLLRVRSESKLSPAAMETLAIIAYKQPVIRADIEAIRGVAVGEVIRSLCYKGLIKIVGRAEVLGRPMLYGTTKKFLEVFGLNTLKDLPKIEELKKPPN
ncbi:MAG: SMC-Scp complex subunit ScpB [Sedimentisphaerales bacterium]|nr:SMC-Scp complex subunit ScpB [Sedimentisphaerales bacterium]